MPDEDLPADEAAETKPKRKPAAKKAAQPKAKDGGSGGKRSLVPQLPRKS